MSFPTRLGEATAVGAGVEERKKKQEKKQEHPTSAAVEDSRTMWPLAPAHSPGASPSQKRSKQQSPAAHSSPPLLQGSPVQIAGHPSSPRHRRILGQDVTLAVASPGSEGSLDHLLGSGSQNELNQLLQQYDHGHGAKQGPLPPTSPAPLFGRIDPSPAAHSLTAIRAAGAKAAPADPSKPHSSIPGAGDVEQPADTGVIIASQDSILDLLDDHEQAHAHPPKHLHPQPAAGKPPLLSEDTLVRRITSQMEVQTSASIPSSDNAELLSSTALSQMLFASSPSRRGRTRRVPVQDAMPSNPPLASAPDQAHADNADRSHVSNVTPTTGHTDLLVHRLRVLSVTQIAAPSAGGLPTKRLAVEAVATSRRFCVLLREDWYFSPVERGTIIELVPFEPSSVREGDQIVLDNHHARLLVVEPDRLLSATRVASSFDCTRRAVLAERFQSLDLRSEPMVVGTLLHIAFQCCLAANDFQLPRIHQELRNAIDDHLLDIFAVDQSERGMLEQLLKYAPLIAEWGLRYVQPASPPPARSTPRVTACSFSHRADAQAEPDVAITRLVDIEENCWAPRLGLKGKIDATVHIHISPAARSSAGAGVPEKDAGVRLGVPLELKTGKPMAGGRAEHRAQVILYALMLSELERPIDVGLLHYLRGNELIQVPIKYNELRHLMLARNELASSLGNAVRFPDMLRLPSECRRCFSLDLCCTVHALLEDGTPETSGLGDEFVRRTGHLGPAHAEFFRNYTEALAYETKACNDREQQSDLWNVPLSQALAAGTTLAPLTIIKNTGIQDARARFRYTYTFAVDAAVTRSLRGSATAHLVVGDGVVISCLDPVRFAITTGILLHAEETLVVVAVEEGLLGLAEDGGLEDDELDAEHPSASASAQRWLAAHSQDCQYRLDKLVRGLHVKAQLGTLADLLVSGLPVFESKNSMANSQHTQGAGPRAFHRRRSELLMELKAPRFVPLPTAERDALATELSALGLNAEQQAVVQGIFRAEDYLLVQGMPGTGKTTLIAAAVQALVARDQRVLLTAYTHSAVDNILLKLMDTGIPILRLGRRDSVHPKVHPFLDSELTADCTSVADLRRLYGRIQVVAATALGANHVVLDKYRFDVCIVDEASQISQAVTMQPIQHANRFVLVGDHFQLPPLVHSVEARKLGLGLSLFKRLCDAHGTALLKLTTQYRMAPVIMDLANHLFYDRQMKCGLPTPASGIAPAWDHARLARQPDWLQQSLDPQRGLIFLDTDGCEAFGEAREQKAVTNMGEALLLTHLTAILLALGVDVNELGVIVPYRAQLALIRRLFVQHGVDAHVEVSTVDRYQGRDKDVVLVGFVRQNINASVGELFADWRRLNVAITRSKTKLLMVGSRRTLQSNEFFAQVFAFCGGHDGLITLPRNAAGQAHAAHESLTLDDVFAD